MSNEILIQTTNEPFINIDEINKHITAVRSALDWCGAGILYDQKPGAVLFVLIKEGRIEAVFRCSLSIEDSVDVAVSMIPAGVDCFEIAAIPDVDFSADVIHDLTLLNSYWVKAQSKHVQKSELKSFFDQLYTSGCKTGRGATINTVTKNQVLLDSHGRCMFKGCAVDLTHDALTGKSGNFSTLAHNVASSERGTRGILFLSDQLSNEPENVLALCDIHHRLIDLVAKVDYPAYVITAMREQFGTDINKLLDSMQYTPLPAICVCWPVREDHFSLPTAQQIAESLAPLKARWSGETYAIVEKDESLRSAPLKDRWGILPAAINGAALRVEMLASDEKYRAALFATGTMPALIALGAKIGNKSEILPMLKHRECGRWFWPSEVPTDSCTNITGLEALSPSEPNVIVQLALTASPSCMETASQALGHNIITINPHKEFGNGALAHFQDGLVFRQRMQELLHELKDKHSVSTIHLMPCASNVACVLFGQAYDNYHPDITLYDFSGDGKSMLPRLRLSCHGNKCEVRALSN